MKKVSHQNITPSYEIPDVLRRSICSVGVEYVRAFSAGVSVPLPQVISDEILKAIAAATMLRRVT